MSAKAGEVSRNTSRYRCEGCQQQTTLNSGALIGECPNCGGSSFHAGWRTVLPETRRRDVPASMSSRCPNGISGNEPSYAAFVIAD